MRWKNKNRHISSFQVIILGFLLVILTGSLCLMLPFSTQDGHGASFMDSLFTATSAVCVTGLVVHDTATYWSAFGQGVILFLIQVGGMGVVTVAVMIAVISGRKISLMQRSMMSDAISAPQVGGIVRLTGFILRATLLFEAAGAVALMPVFCRDYGLRGIWMGMFHSISAFCNAGFDLLGTEQAPYVSLTAYAADPLVSLVIAGLIVAGGLGFLTWEDIRTHRLDLRRYRMQSKVILATTGLLILLPTVYFFFFEFTQGSIGQRFLLSLFQAITPRTAGFNTAQLAEMSGGSQSLMITLMLTGGSPGSTAGGIKNTTLAVLIATAVATFRRREDAQFFGRRLDGSVVKQAVTVLGMYLVLFYGGALAISTLEGLPMSACLYETASAVATVGLTLGITPTLGAASQLILIALMFLGRVGGLTLIYAAFSSSPVRSRLPQEKITVG